MSATGDPGVAAPGGHRIVRLDALGTAAFVAVTVVASLSDADVAALANLAVSTVLFAGGCVAFAIGFWQAAQRSRTEELTMAGVVYLTGAAPTGVRRSMLGLWFVQIVVAVVSVFTVSPPFGVMAPIWGIGLIPLWAARHGTFARRRAVTRPGHRSAPQ